MNIIRMIAILALGSIITGCGVIEYIANSESQGAIEEGNGSVVTQDAPPALHYVLGNALSPLDQSSYCWTGESSAMCVDMIPPIYEESQHILLPAHSLELVFFPPVPDTVNAWIHPGSSVMEAGEDISLQAELSEDGTVALTFPDNASGRFILMVSAQWEAYGDSLYTMPILLD